MEFKDKLKNLRSKQGISQQQLADAIYVSRSAVAKWENGLGYPSQDSFEALANYFGVDSTYFQTEEPEAVIVQKNQYIRRLCQGIGAVALSMLLIAGSVVAAAWFGSASSADMETLAKQAENYFGINDLEVMQTDQRGNYLAALCRDGQGEWCMCVYDRDNLFRDRWVASGGKRSLDQGQLESWNYGSPDREAVLIFCGYNLSEDILFYSFSNAGVDYTCAVNGDIVLDIFIIVDTQNINGHPVPLDASRNALQ